MPSPLTPQQAAEQALAAIDPTTAVSTDGTRTVAGRDAYELVLAPKDTRSLVGQVRLAVDAETSVPLRVQLFGRASADGPAFSVGFTKISFEVPGDDQFRFSPPPGATVDRGHRAEAARRPPVRAPTWRGPAARSGPSAPAGPPWWWPRDRPRPPRAAAPAGAILDQLQRVQRRLGQRPAADLHAGVGAAHRRRPADRRARSPPELLYAAAAR